MREDWVECTFGEIINFKNGFAFKSSDYISEGIPIIRIGDINQNKISIEDSKNVKESSDLDEYLIKKGDILIAMSGATTGKFGMYNLDSKAYLNQRVGNIFPKSIDLVFKPFLFYLLHFLKRQIEKDAYGGAQPNISSKKIEEMKVPFIPLPEQRAIVKKIEALFSSLDAGIADLKKTQDQLKIYRQAVLKKAFEGELTKEWREKSKISKVPLKEILILSSLKHKADKPEELFYVGLEHIEKDLGVLTENVRVELITTVKNKFEENNILYGKLRPYLNKVYLSKENGVCSTDILVFKISERVLGKYIHQFMLSREFVNDMSNNTSGVNLPRVSTKYIENYLVPLPSLDEQAQIVKEIEARLSVCDAVEQQIKDSLTQAEALRQSILKKAFEGKLLSEEEIKACQQESDYEPASVLLEKIKA